MKKLEQQLDKLNRQKTDIERQLAEPGIYEDINKDRLSELLQQQSKLIPTLQGIEEQWLELSEQLEG